MGGIVKIKNGKRNRYKRHWVVQ